MLCLLRAVSAGIRGIFGVAARGGDGGCFQRFGDARPAFLRLSADDRSFCLVFPPL